MVSNTVFSSITGKSCKNINTLLQNHAFAVELDSWWIQHTLKPCSCDGSEAQRTRVHCQRSRPSAPSHTRVEMRWGGQPRQYSSWSHSVSLHCCWVRTNDPECIKSHNNHKNEKISQRIPPNGTLLLVYCGNSFMLGTDQQGSPREVNCWVNTSPWMRTVHALDYGTGITFNIQCLIIVW